MNIRRFLILIVIMIVIYQISPAAVAYTNIGGSYSSDTQIYVHDNANLLLKEDIAKLKTNNNILLHSKCDNILFLTCDDTNNKDTKEYSSEYMENFFPDGSSNVCFIIDLFNKELYVNTSGNLVDAISSSDLQLSLTSGYSSILDGEYIDAFISMAQYCFEHISQDESMFNFNISKTGVNIKNIDSFYFLYTTIAAFILSGSVVFFKCKKKKGVNAIGQDCKIDNYVVHNRKEKETC